MKRYIILHILLMCSLISFAQKKQLILTNIKPFKVIEKDILVQKARYDYIYTPPIWQTDVKKVLVVPIIMKKWRKVPAKKCCFGKPEDCKIWVLEDADLQFRHVTYQRLKKPMTFDVKWVPAQYKKIRQAVLDTAIKTSMMTY